MLVGSGGIVFKVVALYKYIAQGGLARNLQNIREYSINVLGVDNPTSGKDPESIYLYKATTLNAIPSLPTSIH